MIPVVFSWFRKPPIGNYKVFRGLHDAMECALRYSGGPVYLITDMEQDEFSDRVIRIPVSELGIDLDYYEYKANLWKSIGRVGIPWLNIPSNFRWLACRCAHARKLIPDRCCFPDSDLLIFSDLEKAAEPFAGNDILCPQIHNGHKGTTNPIILFSMNPVDDFLGLLGSDVDRAGEFTTDMARWMDVYNSRKYRVVDVGIEHAETQSIFDGNIAYNRDASFATDDIGYKKVIWVRGLPHFERSIGGLVRTHTLHCWGQYKSRMEGIVEKARLLYETQPN